MAESLDFFRLMPLYKQRIVAGGFVVASQKEYGESPLLRT